MAENEVNIIQELRERLIKIETLLEQKFVVTDLKTKDLDDRVGKVEENQTWLWRTVIGGFIGAVIAFFINK